MSDTESTDVSPACSSCRRCEVTGDAPALTISRLPQPAVHAGTPNNERSCR